MTKFRDTSPESFIHGLKQIHLSTDDKAAMRARLIAYADLHEVHDTRRSVASPFVMWRLGAVLAGVIILLGGSVGISYAAEDSLPGQPLYAVKVSVVEPVQGAIIPTTEGKAAWENVLAERRLAEASTLAAQNNLTASTSAYLETQIAIHTNNAEQDANTLAVAGKTQAALQVRSDLEARLSAHATLLAIIEPQLAARDDATTSARVAILYKHVETAKTLVRSSREASEATLEHGADVSTTASTTDSTSGSIAIATIAETRSKEESTLFAKRAAEVFPFFARPMIQASSSATTTATTTAAHENTSVSATTTIQTQENGL